jgi:tetratricopeptide (TPR) repeat protein
LNRILLCLLTLALACRAATEERGQLDASPTLFTIMSAMDAAGVGGDVSSPANHPLRAAVRAEIAKRNVPCLADLKKYFTIHRQKNDVLELSQYISFGLWAGGPPDFRVRSRDVDVPPDVSSLMDFGGLLATFHKDAGIDDLFRRSQPAIEQYLRRYHAPVSEMVLQVNSYLRQQTSGVRGRHFQVYVELLGPPNQIQTRSYGNIDTIVLTPSREPQIFDVRHAFLHHVIEPLTTRHQEAVMRKRGLGDHAQRAQALPEHFKSDFLLLTSECLIKAIEARLDRKPAMAADAFREGYVLTPYFTESLPAYENQEAAMSLYYADLIKGIELRKEDARLTNVEFAREAKVRQAKPTAAPPPPPPLAGAAKTLEDAENLYSTRNLDQAKQLYLAALQQTDDRSLHAAAYYGLARIAALQKDPDSAERLFQKVLELQPEPAVRAWALVYLGRLADAAGERDQAAQHYRGSLEIQGGSDAARKAAEQGLQQSTKK